MHCLFVLINLVLVFVTATTAILLVGSPVSYCYMYTCTIITLLRHLFGLRTVGLSLNVISITCSIFIYYAYYTPWKNWAAFNGADKKKFLTFYVFGVFGAFGGGLPFTLALLIVLRIRWVFRFSILGGG